MILPHPVAYPVPHMFRGHVVRVIDGDTVAVDVDLGFDAHMGVSVRIQDLNAPEVVGVERDRGLEAKAILAALLPFAAPIMLASTERRSFTRYVGALLYWDAAPQTLIDVAATLIAMRPDLFTKAT